MRRGPSSVDPGRPASVQVTAPRSTGGPADGAWRTDRWRVGHRGTGGSPMTAKVARGRSSYQPFIHRVGPVIRGGRPRRFDPFSAHRVPFVGHETPTGAVVDPVWQQARRSQRRARGGLGPDCNASRAGGAGPTNEGIRREQAHLPAQQPSSGQDARLPSADAHPRRPRDPRRSPPQGSQEPRGLTSGLRREPVRPAPSPCCPRHTASPTPRRSVTPRGAADVPPHGR
jgi:hypothetical protein